MDSQQNLRKRVSASLFRKDENTADNEINATYYNYDLGGNVKTLWQQVNGLGEAKRVDYEYDLVSGKVNFVGYQDGDHKDRFYYQYKYDAENRLTEAWSGVGAIRTGYGMHSKLFGPMSKLNAHYEYYLHGPLARVELGDELEKLQGMDYAYTLQGWIKGVNGQKLATGQDISNDGVPANTSKDAFAYSLGYYQNDYKAIGTTATAFNLAWTPSGATGSNLYNGNISHATYAIANVNEGKTAGYTYRYDQLNRLKNVRQHDLSSTTGIWPAATDHYAENFAYDANGNIKSLQRYKGNTVMDNLAYTYNTAGEMHDNKLRKVFDSEAESTDANDIDGTTTYEYDAIGNLVREVNGSSDQRINWTVYGKISDIKNADGSNIATYSYDPAGNRVSKVTNNKTTFYVRDAQGNSLAVYEKQGTALTWKEQQLYGSSRLGMWKAETDINTTEGSSVWDNKGKINYELTNHLGNVMAVITDKRLPLSGGGYEAEVVNAQDYYAFGMTMRGRSFSSGCYRYGFNGKENDNEVKGEGNQQDYGMRIYDPRLGRFLSVDPLTKGYPMLTPYQFASNTPIAAIDLDGLEAYIATETKGTGHAFLVVKTDKELLVYTYGRYGAVDWNQTSGEGVLQRLSGAAAVDYINTEMTRMDAQFFEIGDVSANNLVGVVDAVYNKGTASSVEGTEGKVVDSYSLFSSNCSSHSSDWLQDAGTNAFGESIMGVDYNEDFIIPSSLQNYLNAESKDGSKQITPANNAMKRIIAEEQAKQKLQGAGRMAESSGSSGRSSGSSANSSSSGSSTGRWTSGASSSGSSSGSSLGSSSSGPLGSSAGSSSGSSSGNSSGSSSSRRRN